MYAAKTLFKMCALVGAGAVGVILNLRRLKHLAERDAHTLGNRSRIAEN